MSITLGLLTLAVNAIVTRATARLPDGGDTFAVAAPTHTVVSPNTRLYPRTTMHCQGVQWSGPELGVVTPAGLGAALGQKELGYSQPEDESTLSLPPTLNSAPGHYLLP